MKHETKKRVARLALLLAAITFTRVAMADDDIKVQYKVGDGLYIGDSSNQVHIQNRVAGRFTYTGVEKGFDTDTFSIPRGELRIDGYTLNKTLKFGFEMNMATRAAAKTLPVCGDAACTPAKMVNAITSDTTTGLAVLNDYYLDYVPRDYIGIRAGQFKVPFLMQQLTSSTKQQFVDRSLANGFFDLTRDIGVDIHGGLWEHGLRYDLFVMNGDGPNNFNNLNSKGLMVGTRLELPIVGEYKNSESDVEYSLDPNFGVGVAYVFNEAPGTIQGGTIALGTKMSNGTIDAGYKYKGFSIQSAAMVSRSHQNARLTNWGYNVQAGYFLIPKHLEIAARGDGTVFSGAVVNQYEYSGAINYYIVGHGIKLQSDYALLHNARGAGLNDHRIRMQFQIIF